MASVVRVSAILGHKFDALLQKCPAQEIAPDQDESTSESASLHVIATLVKLNSVSPGKTSSLAIGLESCLSFSYPELNMNSHAGVKVALFLPIQMHHELNSRLTELSVCKGTEQFSGDSLKQGADWRFPDLRDVHFRVLGEQNVHSQTGVSHRSVTVPSIAKCPI